MLKNFMHPTGSPAESKTTGGLRTDNPLRSDHNRYGHSSAAADATRPNDTPKPEAAPAASAPAEVTAEDGNKLIVGPNIKLKGSEITDCEILVVEGRVEASMNSRDIRIAEGGVFSGKAEIDVAEVRGHFEGELTARKRLVIYATGKVSGVIRYGAMMVEEGGIVSGDVATLSPSTSASVSKVAGLPTPSKDATGAASESDEAQSPLTRSGAARR